MCQAGRDFGSGEQVFIFYGTRTCAEQFIHNGFVDINNAHDALTLKVGLSKSDPLAGQRATLLFKLRILSGNPQHIYNAACMLDMAHHRCFIAIIYFIP